MGDGAVPVMVTRGADESGYGTGRGTRHRSGHQRLQIQRPAGTQNPPPETGGITATSSPSDSAVSRGTYSRFRA